jgi:DNA repair exonuclease SbcCD nuclease subunit
MARIALLSDVHLGIGNRQKDILWALNAVKKYCAKNNIENVVILGDLFHDRQSLDIDVLCTAYDFFKSAKEQGQTWAAFPGNHDMFLKHSWNINSIKPLGEVLTIIDTIKIIQLEDTRFWILPFVYSESSYLKILRRIEEQYQPGDILLTHTGVCTAKLNVCFLLQQWNIIDLADSKFRRIYAGHFHLKQQVGENLWYPGSIIPFKFDEGDSPHGFYIYDTESQDHEFINIWKAGKLNENEPAAPQYKNLHGDLLKDKKPGDIAGCNVRIAVTREHSPNEKQEIRKQLAQMGAKRVVFTDMLLEDDDVKLNQDDEGEATKIEDLFEKWFDADARGTKGLQRNLALKLNREIILEGNEIYTKQD